MTIPSLSILSHTPRPIVIFVLHANAFSPSSSQLCVRLIAQTSPLSMCPLFDFLFFFYLLAPRPTVSFSCGLASSVGVAGEFCTISCDEGWEKRYCGPPLTQVWVSAEALKSGRRGEGLMGATDDVRVDNKLACLHPASVSPASPNVLLFQPQIGNDSYCSAHTCAGVGDWQCTTIGTQHAIQLQSEAYTYTRCIV